ncbi:DoxX family protein [Rhodococcus sp. ARC_M6]|uniref:DoxX family protein n=1 Tax=Rhodococcus sp. ARC_M6 TaxID=2928852 RepID=UPI001FB36F1A|nr:DoxX family protein [Rhodococcus sp. ARC_M6]MCJ0906143.1 DoxX family protein [Rhodococcus sp. ARC_M6]
MFIAYVVIAAILTATLAGSAYLDLTREEKLVASLTGLGVPEDRIPQLGLIKLAGIIGLLVGLWIPAIGIAAAIGLTLYFVGAVVAHLKAGDHQIAPPAMLGLLSAAALVLRIVSM